MSWINVLKHGLQNDSREDREIIADFDKEHARYMEWSKRATPDMKTSGGMKSEKYERYQATLADILKRLSAASKSYSTLISENISDSPRRTVMREPFKQMPIQKEWKAWTKNYKAGRYDNYQIDVLIKQINGVLVALEDDLEDYDIIVDDQQVKLTIELLKQLSYDLIVKRG